MDVDELLGGAIGGAVLELLKQRLVREILVPAPGAGLEWSQTVPASTTWELLSASAQLGTSAVVATRNPSLRVLDADGNLIARFGMGNTLAANASTVFGCFTGFGAVTTTNSAQAPLPTPPLSMAPGWTVRAVTSSLDVGDTWNLIALTVREWEPSLVQRNLDWIIGTLR